MASKHGPKSLKPEIFRTRRQMALSDRVLMLAYGMTPEQYAEKYIKPLYYKEMRKQAGGHLGSQGRILAKKYLKEYIKDLSKPTAIDEYFGEYNPQKALESFKYGVAEPQRERFMKEVPEQLSQKYGRAFRASYDVPAYVTEQAESANKFARDIATQEQDYLQQDMQQREQERMNLISAVTSGQQVYNVPRQPKQNFLTSFTKGALEAVPGAVETYMQNSYKSNINQQAGQSSQRGQASQQAQPNTQQRQPGMTAQPVQRFGQANNLNR
jgi:hypothetical protein